MTTTTTTTTHHRHRFCQRQRSPKNKSRPHKHKQHPTPLPTSVFQHCSHKQHYCYQQRHPNKSQYPNKSHPHKHTFHKQHSYNPQSDLPCLQHSTTATSSTTQTCHTFTSAFPQATLLPASVIQTPRHPPTARTIPRQWQLEPSDDEKLTELKLNKKLQPFKTKAKAEAETVIAPSQAEQAATTSAPSDGPPDVPTKSLPAQIAANEHSAPGIDPVAPPLGDVLQSVASCCVIFDCLITRLSNEPLNFYLLHRISVHIFSTDCLFACLNAAIIQ